MDFYLLKELSCFFLFSFSSLTSLGVAIGTAGDLVNKIVEYRLPILIACQIFCCKIPEYAAYALPISILLTCLIVYGRLNDNCELTALLSFGISFYRLIVPALILSIAIAIITFLLNELIVPAANYQASLLQTPFIPKSELNQQQQNIFYAEYKSGEQGRKKLIHIYFAELYEQPWLRRVTILSYRNDRLVNIITAQSAQWHQQQVWDLKLGIVYSFNPDTQTNSAEEFIVKQLSLPKTVFEIANKQRSSEDMNIRQAKEYLNLIEDSALPREVAQYAVRIQQKYAFPSICVVFALMGSALGGKYSQLNRSKSFGLCVSIVFTYYFLAFAIGSVGITGLIPPFLAGWLPNIIVLIVSAQLLKFANS